MMYNLRISQGELDYLLMVVCGDGPFLDDDREDTDDEEAIALATASMTEKVYHLSGKSAAPPDANRVWEALKSMI